MSPAPRQYEAIVALLAANDVTNSAIRDKQDANELVTMNHREAGRILDAKDDALRAAHELVTMKHREVGRILDAKDDALRLELHENAAKTRALRAEKETRLLVNNRESVYRTGR